MSTFAADMDEAMRLGAEIKTLADEGAAISRVAYETGPRDVALACIVRTQEITCLIQEKQIRQVMLITRARAEFATLSSPPYQQ